MAVFEVEVPDDSITLIKAWVDSVTNAGIVNGWTNAQYSHYVSIRCRDWLRAQVIQSQQVAWLQAFVPDDPIIYRSSVSVFMTGSA